VLDELLRLGIVEVTDDEIVILKVDAFVPNSGFDEKAHYFGQNLSDHIAAAAHNLGSEQIKFLERAVSYHNLSEPDVTKIKALAKDLSIDALKIVNSRARQMQRRSQSKLGVNHRVNFGAYFFSEAVADKPMSRDRDSNSDDLPDGG
jgi:hypothetical protein